MVSRRRGFRGRYENDFREGPIHIYPNFSHAIVATIFLIIGASILGIASKYSNYSIIPEDHSCPALEGRVHDWVKNEGILFIFISGIVFSVAGIIPKIFHVCQLRDNAICCGKIFMSNFGYVTEFIGFALFILYNVYGTVLTREAHERGIQSEVKYPREKFEMYCSKVIWNTYRVTNYGKKIIFPIMTNLTSSFDYRHICSTWSVRPLFDPEDCKKTQPVHKEAWKAKDDFQSERTRNSECVWLHF